MARPQKPIDPRQVEQLAMIQCSYEEMAAVLDCNPSTLTRRFAQEIKNGREKGRTSLKRMQYVSAEKGNIAMQIWLGKQYLGQRDNQFIQGSGFNSVIQILSPTGTKNRLTENLNNEIRPEATAS